ncbi:MAG: mannitol dehydrogenase family protein [Pseudomonadota bacterium]
MASVGQGMGAVKLGNGTLTQLPEGVLKPLYDRTRLTPGIVHIGLGNFHRAHQAWFLHRLMQNGKAHDWAIVGAGVRPADTFMRDKLLGQDCLTTLVELDPSGGAVEITGAMIDFLPVEQGNAALIAQMTAPEIRIVSLTVTEGGYYRKANGDLDTAHPDIAHDAANPNAPRTAFGAIVAALRARRDAGIGPFTAQCCDNLQHNGDVLRSTIVGLAALSDPDLAGWINANCSFPNAMVDCIVPATGPVELASVHALGIDDAAPVTHENYRQWVIEDDFCAGRPPWEDVGVTLTDAVHRYETMKIRVLNAGHQVLANLGELLGAQTIADCMEHAEIAAFFQKVQRDEILSHVQAVPDVAPLDYLELVSRRFANPMIHDTTRRVAFDGSSRHAGFILPIIRDALAADAPIDGLALTEALWSRMCAGTREDGSEIAPNDPQWDTLTAFAALSRDAPRHWLTNTSVYGDLGENERFAAAFETQLRAVWDQGSAAAVRAYTG